MPIADWTCLVFYLSKVWAECQMSLHRHKQASFDNQLRVFPNLKKENTQNVIGQARHPFPLGREACECNKVSIAAEASKIAAPPGPNVSLARLHELILRRAVSMTTNEVIRYLLKQGADITVVPGIRIIRNLNEEK
jgi:hypothetical protein